MKLKKVTSTRWNGVGFGNTSAAWIVAGFPDWYVSSRNGDWIAINQKTGARVTGYTRDILSDKLSAVLTQGA